MLQYFVPVLLDRKCSQSFQLRMLCLRMLCDFLPPLLPAGVAVEVPLPLRILIWGWGVRV